MGMTFRRLAGGVKTRALLALLGYADPMTEPGFDAVLTRLRSVVERLETGQLGLEEALAVYEEGVGLARRGHQLLDAAEKKVELLVSTTGGVETVPMPPASSEDAPT
jgi:exodeoxyribonuclease VII small subunit